ncbi:glycosyl hydrolase 53 family protein [Balneolales bacterium ANBcel1]|nr:glycosyl hydrolase 53 family protein [Balneolales bacterium ANBcel1]
MIFTLRLSSLAAAILLLLSIRSGAQDQSFYFGNDLSYVNQMEDCRAEYLYQGEPADPFGIFAGQETNLVRARLWVDPSWWQEPLSQPDGVRPYYSDLEDVIKTFRRARDYGMELMLDLHYSDIWADPGRQLIPRAWKESAHDVEALADSIYNYTAAVLSRLEDEGLAPEFVKVGNENNAGILLHLPGAYTQNPSDFGPAESVARSGDFERNATLFNAGIRAVREFGQTGSINPKIALHWSNLNGLQWWYGEMTAAGVTDFDIIGFSYYYAWHEGSIGQLESLVETMVDTYPEYEVMAVETGYLWSQDYGGIINTPDPEYLPVIPEKQLEYMVDYTRAVMRAGGNGVIFWEPAWVDTPCRTPWITGSSHTHVAFFHPDDLNFMENGGGKWTNRRFYEDPHWPKVTFRVDMSGVDVAEEGAYITGSFTGEDGDWELIPMADEGNGIFSWFTYLPEGDDGAFYFVNGNDWDARESVPEACAEHWDTDRGFVVPGEDVIFEFEWESCQPPGDHDEVEVTFSVDMSDAGVEYDGTVYMTGSFTGNGDWEIVPMNHHGNQIYAHVTYMAPGAEGAYYFMYDNSWGARESVPAECADWWSSDRGYVIPDEPAAAFAFRWGTCEAFEIPTDSEGPGDVPGRMALQQNYPNPFNPATLITYEVSEANHVTLRVYNMVGQTVATLADAPHAPGVYRVEFDGSHLSSGVYMYVLQAGDAVYTRSMTLLK